VVDLMVFLGREGAAEGAAPLPAHGIGEMRVAYHDACHALRAQHIRAEPRRVLGRIPGLEVVDIPGGETCCGAAGLFNLTQPEMADRLMHDKAEAVSATGASIVASANPGCTMQIVAGARALGLEIEVVHPVQLLDRAYAADPG